MKKAIPLLFAFLLLISGCGQPSYVGKTITYVDAGTLNSASFWYEVPEEWDCLDGVNDSTFIPNKDDTIIVLYGHSKIDEILNTISTASNDNIPGTEWDYEELTVNGNRALKFAAHGKNSTHYRYLIDFGSSGTIMIKADDIIYSRNPYEKEMDHILNTIKVI